MGKDEIVAGTMWSKAMVDKLAELTKVARTQRQDAVLANLSKESILSSKLADRAIDNRYWLFRLADALKSAADDSLLVLDYFPTPAEKLPKQEQHGYHKTRKYDASLRPSAAKVSTIFNIFVNIEFTKTDPLIVASNPLIGASNRVAKYQQAIDDLLTFQPTRLFVPTLSFHGVPASVILPGAQVSPDDKVPLPVVVKATFVAEARLWREKIIVDTLHAADLQPGPAYTPKLLTAFAAHGSPLGLPNPSEILRAGKRPASALEDLPTMVPRHLEIMVFASPRETRKLKDVPMAAEFLPAAEQLFRAILDAFRRGILHRDISVNNILVADNQLLMIDWEIGRRFQEPSPVALPGAQVVPPTRQARQISPANTSRSSSHTHSVPSTSVSLSKRPDPKIVPLTAQAVEHLEHDEAPLVQVLEVPEASRLLRANASDRQIRIMAPRPSTTRPASGHRWEFA
ncbi:hypothetical protein FB451DRAFT_1500213 [Mycena latifolia]|nr:hypothetical protein FB451DRAFT_1500213 [Mycena latifolia]